MSEPTYVYVTGFDMAGEPSRTAIGILSSNGIVLSVDELESALLDRIELPSSMTFQVPIQIHKWPEELTAMFVKLHDEARAADLAAKALMKALTPQKPQLLHGPKPRKKWRHR